MEATPRIELGIKVLQTSALPLGYVAVNWCRGPESNRYGYHYPRDFKSLASASSATAADTIKGGAENEIRTRDPLLGKEVLYH